MGDGINKVILVGNLGKDPELSYTQSGIAKCKFSLATTETYSGGQGGDERQERTEWHNIVAWRKQAEVVSKYLKKGRQVYIEGKIQTRSWDDSASGTKKYITEIQADKILFIGGAGNTNYAGKGEETAESRRGTEDSRSSNGGTFGSFGQDDDIPF